MKTFEATVEIKVSEESDLIMNLAEQWQEFLADITEEAEGEIIFWSFKINHKEEQVKA